LPCNNPCAFVSLQYTHKEKSFFAKHKTPIAKTHTSKSHFTTHQAKSAAIPQHLKT
jgi:hypothetical protein